MKKFGLMAVFIVFLVLSFSSVEGQIRTEARTAGYHNFTYTNYIQNLDTSIPAIYVWPSTFVIGGNNPGTSMQIVGSAGSYTFNSIAAGSIFSFSDPVTVNGLLRVNSDVVTGTLTASGFINANGGLTSTGNFIIRLS